MNVVYAPQPQPASVQEDQEKNSFSKIINLQHFNTDLNNDQSFSPSSRVNRQSSRVLISPNFNDKQVIKLVRVAADVSISDQFNFQEQQYKEEGKPKQKKTIFIIYWLLAYICLRVINIYCDYQYFCLNPNQFFSGISNQEVYGNIITWVQLGILVIIMIIELIYLIHPIRPHKIQKQLIIINLMKFENTLFVHSLLVDVPIIGFLIYCEFNGPFSLGAKLVFIFHSLHIARNFKFDVFYEGVVLAGLNRGANQVIPAGSPRQNTKQQNYVNKKKYLYIQLFLCLYSALCLLSTINLKSFIDIIVLGLATSIFFFVFYIIYTTVTEDNYQKMDKMVLLQLIPILFSIMLIPGTTASNSDNNSYQYNLQSFGQYGLVIYIILILLSIIFNQVFQCTKYQYREEDRIKKKYGEEKEIIINKGCINCSLEVNYVSGDIMVYQMILVFLLNFIILHYAIRDNQEDQSYVLQVLQYLSLSVGIGLHFLRIMHDELKFTVNVQICEDIVMALIFNGYALFYYLQLDSNNITDQSLLNFGCFVQISLAALRIIKLINSVFYIYLKSKKY